MKKIDYFCFSVPEVGKTDYVPKSDDDELTTWLKKTELALLKKAEENDMLVVFDRTTKRFYKGGKPIDLKDKRVFPKTWLPYEKELLTNLDKSGADSLLTYKDALKTMEWPNYVQPKHRKSVHTTYGEFQKNYKKYQNIFDSVFLKTAEKSHKHYWLKFYGELDLGGTKLFFTKPPIMNMSDDQKIILSEEYFQIEDKENNNCKEYRAFVVDGEILSISRSYIDYPTVIPDEVLKFAEEFVAYVNTTDFVKNYCIDFGEMKLKDKEIIDLVEINDLACAGQEVMHDLIGEYLKKVEREDGEELE